MQKPTARFTQQGKRVMLNVGGKIQNFRLSKGFEYLLHILSHPGTSYYASMFNSGKYLVDPGFKYLSELPESALEQQGLSGFDFLPPIHKADRQTVKEVSARLNCLIQLEVVLRENNDLAALDDLIWEKEQLCLYLHDVLSVRNRLASIPTEDSKSARQVYKSLARVYKQIAECEPELAIELKSRIIAWHKVCYLPGEWEIEVA